MAGGAAGAVGGCVAKSREECNYHFLVATKAKDLNI
jgi:hypothetical protein